MKVAGLAAACLAAGGGTAYAVAKLHGGSTSAAPKASSFRTGVIGRPDGFFVPRGPRLGFGGRDGLSGAADYLKLSQAELLAKLASGQTLAQIAQANGKSVSGLVDAMVAAQKSELDAAVKDGRLTRAQADELTANLKDKITALVNGGFGFHRFHDRFDDDPPATPL